MICWSITRARKAITVLTDRTSGLLTMAITTTTTMWILNTSNMHRKHPQTTGVTVNIEVEDQVVVGVAADVERLVDMETSVYLGQQQEHSPTWNYTLPNMMRKKKITMSTVITKKIIHTSPLAPSTLHILSHFFMSNHTSSTTIFNRIGLYF